MLSIITYFSMRVNIMIYRTYYLSPLGRMLLAADDMGLVGAWFEGQKYLTLMIIASLMLFNGSLCFYFSKL